MSEIISRKEDTPEELTLAEKLIDDAKVNEAHELLNNFERKEGLTLQDKVSSHVLRIDLLFQQGRYKEVLTLAEETHDLSLGLGKNLLSVDCFILMAESLVWYGEPDKVLDIVIQAEELLKTFTQVLSSEYIKREASIAKIKGLYYYRKLDIDLALKHHKHSLKLGEKIDFKKLIAIVLKILSAVIAEYKGDVDLAFEYVKKGVAIAKESKNKFTIAQCLLSLGEMYRFIGDWERGLKIYDESLSIYEEFDNKERMSTALSNMSEAYRDFTEDYDRALEYMEASLAVYPPDVNYIWAGSRFYNAITIALKKGDHERAKKYLHHLEQMNSQVKRKGIKRSYRLSKALVLKSSSRFRDIAKAEKILRQFINEEVFDFQNSTLPLINLCDILLGEFRVTNNLEILNELEPLITQLLSIAEKTQSHRIQAETYLFQAKLALLSFDVKKSRRFLTQAQQIAERYSLNKLALEISSEHKNLVDRLELWEKLKNSEAPISKRFELAQINEQMERMYRSRVMIKTQITEDKVAIHKERKICLVCRGEVFGFSYICKCGANYCESCARAVSNLENVCWACEEAIDYSKPVKLYKKEEKVEEKAKKEVKKESED